MVGYRKIQAGREDEAESHGLHTAGLFSCRVPKVSRSDQAVLVPTIQDVLNLAAQKIPGKYIWIFLYYLEVCCCFTYIFNSH